MHSTSKIQRALLLVLVLMCSVVVALANDPDDYVPEVTDRVARISFIRGDVQIRRLNSQDWERAVLNLPIVEGDEIVTDSTSRIEIQFNIFMHLRVAENTQLKVVGLKDEGVALSMPTGSVNVRAVEFDPAKSYFEIDVPKTTVSIQKPGSYRIDAGTADSIEIFITANEGGEARVYSPDAGFTVKNGRRARVFIGGNQVGEWEMADASQFLDEFDNWSLERDDVIAARLKGAYYDRYYDRDIYAADDLNDYGDWIYTPTYGYVWRPYRTSISSYNDWSPYRYGHWRWIPSYGWTWVNDEPWGWATYHHGRWVWYNGSWYWTPYAYNRGNRSWWHPALVVVRVVASNVCWYPLPWRYGYYDYNYSYYSHYYRRRNNDNHHGGNWNGNGNGNGNPTPSPTPNVPASAPGRQPRSSPGQPPLIEVPPTGVVTVAVSEFGRSKGRFSIAPLESARTVLTGSPDMVESPPLLPTYNELNGKVSAEIRSVRSPVVRPVTEVPTGASTRRADAPLDQELQKSRMFGNRRPAPVVTSVPPGDAGPVDRTQPVRTRSTGAVGRPILETTSEPSEPVRPAPQPKEDTPPVFAPPKSTRQVEPVRTPRYDPPPKSDDTEPIRPPKYESPRNDPPPKHDPPTRSEPPPRNDPPPKHDPPPKSDPPPPKNDPPPTKPEPKVDTIVDRKKDARLN